MFVPVIAANSAVIAGNCRVITRGYTTAVRYYEHSRLGKGEPRAALPAVARAQRLVGAVVVDEPDVPPLEEQRVVAALQPPVRREGPAARPRPPPPAARPRRDRLGERGPGATAAI